MNRFGQRRAAAVFAALASVLVVLVDSAAARDGKDGRSEVRAAGGCVGRATSELRLKSRDGGIELEFEVDHARAGVSWRVVIVHERRVAWRGAARTSRSSGSFSLERRLADLSGSDSVTVRAWGPPGATCRATATLPAP